MEIKIVGEEAETGQNEVVSINDGQHEVSMPTSLESIAIAQVLDLDLNEVEANKEKIEDLVKWAKSQKDVKSLEDVKWAIRSLESRIGPSPIGEKRIGKIHRFAYLELEEQKIRKEKESIYVN